jgi:hypothetical protein
MANSEVPAVQRLCRQCQLADEVPEHVFMQCTAPATREARCELQKTLQDGYGYSLLLPLLDVEAAREIRTLVFYWDYVVPMARFTYMVARSWRFFGNVLPRQMSEDMPGSEDDSEWVDDEGVYEDWFETSFYECFFCLGFVF